MKLRFLWVLAFALLSCASNDTQSYSTAVQEAKKAADEILEAGGSSVGIALVTRDKVVMANGYGMADVAASVPATGDTLFPIGSVSKMFAAVAVMQLVDQGLVDLHTPLVHYLPSFRMADARYDKITVRMLLNHTSGIGGTLYTSAETTVSVPGYARAVLDSLADQSLKAAPGEYAVYCNDGWTLTDPLVEAVTKMSYVEWVKQKIFAPLGMTRSTFSLAPLPEGSYVKAYNSGVARPQEYVNVDAAGGIYSTPADMAAFVRMFLNEGMSSGGVRVLSKASVEMMGVDQTIGTFNPVPNKGLAYGFGWDTVTEAGLGQAGVKGWTKNGGTFFYGAQITVAPEEGLAAVALGPAGAGYAPLAITQRVLMRALVEKGRLASYPQRLPAQAAPVAPPPAGLLASVEGVYANYAHTYKLTAEADGTLGFRTLNANGFPSAAGTVLKYRSDGWFTSDAAPLMSLGFVSSGTQQYLTVRSSAGIMSYLDSQLYAQKVTGGAPLSAAWSGRLNKKWLVVNEHYSGIPFLVGEDPRFGLMTLTEAPGSLFALPALPPINMGWQSQVVNASASDWTAGMMLRLPGLMATDIYSLDVVTRGGEEWLRWGGYLHRPIETVPVLPAAAATEVAIGAEGYAEWRSIRLGGSPVQLAVSGASAWRLYDQNFTTLASGGASERPEIPSGSGLAFLLLFGGAGGSVTVTVP